MNRNKMGDLVGFSDSPRQTNMKKEKALLLVVVLVVLLVGQISAEITGLVFSKDTVYESGYYNPFFNYDVDTLVIQNNSGGVLQIDSITVLIKKKEAPEFWMYSYWKYGDTSGVISGTPLGCRLPQT